MPRNPENDSVLEQQRSFEQLERHVQELARREEHYRLALESAETGTWEHDLETGQEVWSDWLYRLYGVDKDKVSASEEAWLECVHPDDRERIMGETKAHLDEGQDRFSSQFRVVHPEKGVRWMLSRSRIFRNPEGVAVRISGTVVDITEAKLAEEALQESRQRERARALELEAVMAAVPAVVWIAHDPEATRISGSRAAHELLRVPWGDNMSKSAGDSPTMHFRIYQDDRELRPEELPVQRAARGEELRDFEETLVFEDGQTRHLLGHSRPLRGAQGQVQGAIGAFLDITERKRIEDELTRRMRQQAVVAELGRRALAGLALQELMDEAVKQVAQTLGNEYCQVLELLPEGDALLLRAGAGWREGSVGAATVGTDLDSQAGFTLISTEPVIVEDLGTESRFSGSTLLREHGVVSGLSVIISGKDGPWGVLGTHSTRPAEFTQDDISFVQAVANLLAESIARAHYEQALRRVQDELEERVRSRTAQLQASNQELETFAYSVSHDLRAPLRGMDGFTQALLEDYGDMLDATGKNYLERVRGAATRMGRLIDDLLDLSRLSRRELRKAEVDLSAIVRDLAANLSEGEPGRDVSFEIAEGAMACGDLSLLTVALDNLLGNAWKFTQAKEAARIVFGFSDADGERVFFVRDNGAGFDPRYADKLFAPFQRLHADPRYEGTGIGLATVQRIVRRHGGDVWAEGEVDQGATFYFRLDPEATDAA